MKSFWRQWDSGMNEEGGRKMTIGLGGIITLALIVAVIVIASKVKTQAARIDELTEKLRNK